jgi:flagellar hook-length control protein FliK
MPGVAGQLVDVLSPPRPTAGGTYTVTIALHPEELGEVRATVTAGEDQVTVRLVAATGDGDDALRQALSQLHADLSIGGQRTTVTVGGHGDDASTGWTAGQPTADGQAGGRPDAKDAATATNGASTGDTPAGRGGPPTGSTVASGTTGTKRLIDVRV